MAERVRTVLRHVAAASDSKPSLNLTAGLSVANDVDPYLYTRDSSILTPKQRQFYDENGFLVIKNCVPAEKLDVYRSRFEDICTGKIGTFGMTVMKDIAIAKSEFVVGEKAISKIQDFQWDDVLFQYCKLPEVVKYVRDFVGPNVMSMHTMLINKPPDPGSMTSRHPMHQDLYYFPFRPAERVVCAWTAMEKITRQNGCLVVIPGTHKGEMLEHDYPKWEGGVNKLYHGIVDYDPEKNERVWLEMEKGDTVFFHPILIHGSGANKSTGFRKSISCHYAASECEYIEITDSSKQEKVATEIMEVVKRKTRTHKDIPYKEIWKFRARLVAGEQLKL